MPLESATYIHDLVATNPVHTDGLNQADAHLRLLKTVLQSTFPNLTAAVTAAPADLNATAGLVNATTGTLSVPVPTSSTTTGGSLDLKGAGSHPDITLTNTGSGLSVTSGSTTVALIDGAGNIGFAAGVNGTVLNQAGVPLIPRGIITMWSGSIATIPTGWLLCNGTAGTPDLRNLFIVGAGGTYGVAATGGAASTTPTTSNPGAHTHGGATGAAGGHTPTGVTDVQGAHSHTGQTQGHVLSIAELPAHDHGLGGQPVLSHPGSSAFVGAGGFGVQITTEVSQGSGAAHVHPISVDGAHGHNAAMNAVPDHVHAISSDGAHSHTVAVSTVPPFFALAYIMKA